MYQDLIKADAHHLSFKESVFDSVVCIEVLEHLEKDGGKGLLNELERWQGDKSRFLLM
ncbi:MAG: class I SAM-dependent methyltransferase [Candidatus Brockarchaeota archaeon]|nr:class I SAM-dependent methyltransferase [Candidatus Brockarchaeota archaeon]